MTLRELPSSLFLVETEADLAAAYSRRTNAPIASATNHKALIRLLATFTDDVAKKAYLVSTGEDKLLQVSSLPDLQLLSSRDLPKRANALEVTASGDIVVGDKFGDVYMCVPLAYSLAKRRC